MVQFADDILLHLLFQGDLSKLRRRAIELDIETVKKDLAVALPEYECRGITIGVENHGSICMG